MPDIMLFQSNVRKEPVLKQESARAEDTAVYQVGGALKDLGKAVLGIEERNQTLKARADMAEVQAKMSGWFAERAASGNVESLTEDMQKQLGKELSAATRTNRSAYYAQAVDDAKPALIASFLGQAEQAKIEGTFLENRRQAEKIINAKTAFVRNNPDQWLNAENEVSEALDSVVLDAATKERLKQNARRDIAFVAANEALVNNPQALRRSIRNGAFADFLGVDEQQRFLAATVEQGGAVKTDPAVYAELTARAQMGYNVDTAARAALLSGRLTIADFDKFSKIDVPSNRKKMTQYLNGVAAQGFVRDVALDMRLQEALFAADRWLKENPNASDVEVERQSRVISDNFRLTQRERRNRVLNEARRAAVIGQNYAASDGSSPENPTMNGLKESMRFVLQNPKLSETQKKEAAAAFADAVAEMEEKQTGINNGKR